jgi:hypothetical protein
VNLTVNFLTLNGGFTVNFLTLNGGFTVNFLTLILCKPYLAWPPEVLKTRKIKNKKD